MKIPQHCQEELCNNFFSLFSRFEYAMKAVGYIKKETGDVILLWNDMADTIRQSFAKTKDDTLKCAIHYIMDTPPKNKW